VFGSEYTIEHLPALKNSSEKGRKKDQERKTEIMKIAIILN